jgi:hypothetical protein
MIGEIDRGRCGSTARGERNDVSPPGADRVIEIAPQTAAPRWIGDELIPYDSETRTSAIKVKNFANHRIDEPVNVPSPNSIAISINRNETSPGSVVAVFENHRGRTGVQNRIGSAPKKQPFELTCCLPQSRRAPDFGKVRNGSDNHNHRHYENQNSFDQ